MDCGGQEVVHDETYSCSVTLYVREMEICSDRLHMATIFHPGWMALSLLYPGIDLYLLFVIYSTITFQANAIDFLIYLPGRPIGNVVAN